MFLKRLAAAGTRAILNFIDFKRKSQFNKVEKKKPGGGGGVKEGEKAFFFTQAVN